MELINADRHRRKAEEAYAQYLRLLAEDDAAATAAAYEAWKRADRSARYAIRTVHAQLRAAGLIP